MPSPAPRKFKPAGEIVWAEFCGPPPFLRENRKRKGKRAEGIRYEKKAQVYLGGELEEGYTGSPWLRFRSVESKRPRYCQPDGILFDIEGGRITIFEIKLQHTVDAWWQLEHLYMPVVQFLFPAKLWTLSVCELVKWYDPATAFPVKPKLMRDLRGARPEAFSVHIWKP